MIDLTLIISAFISGQDLLLYKNKVAYATIKKLMSLSCRSKDRRQRKINIFLRTKELVKLQRSSHLMCRLDHSFSAGIACFHSGKSKTPPRRRFQHFTLIALKAMTDAYSGAREHAAKTEAYLQEVLGAKQAALAVKIRQSDSGLIAR